MHKMYEVEIDPYEVLDNLDTDEIKKYLGIDNDRTVTLSKNQWMIVRELVEQSDLPLYQKKEIVDEIIAII